MSKESSYRHILRSTSIIGGASLVNVLLGLVRMKVVAMVLGPSGLGLIGILQQLMTTASAMAGMGLNSSGTRQLSEAVGNNNQAAFIATKRSLFWLTIMLALVGGGLFWTLRTPIASLLFSAPDKGELIGWLAIGVALSVGAGSQMALLNGLRRIGDIARVTIASAATSSVVGIAAIMTWREQGILIFLLVTPAASFVFSRFYVARLPAQKHKEIPAAEIRSQAAKLLQLGGAFMVAGVITAGGQLAVRALVQHESGTAALGYFTASWIISMTYIGFVLQAMGTDFYPRLTASITNHQAANTMVNEQTEMALLLSAPVLIAMLSLAPWIMDLLYSKEFYEAANILRWQIQGDILKVVSWPLGFIILASGNGRLFVYTEGMAIIVFFLATWLLLPVFGIIATGMAFLLMYLVYLPAVYIYAKRKTNFRWSKSIIVTTLVLTVTSALLHVLTIIQPVAGGVIGLFFSSGFAVYAFVKIRKRIQ